MVARITKLLFVFSVTFLPLSRMIAEVLFKTLYWIILGFIHLYICYILFTSGRAITGMLWLVMGFILLLIFYPVFFAQGKTAQWPPYFTACPDYLTQIAPGACVDFVGLNSPLLKRSDPKNPPTPGSADADSYIFNTNGTTQDKVNRAQQYSLTWEGLM